MRKFRIALMILLLAAGMVLAACGGQTDEDPAEETGAEDTTTQEDSDAEDTSPSEAADAPADDTDD